MSKIQTKKVVFFMTNISIQPLWLTHFIEILLVLEFQLTKIFVGVFSYKAHFRPQISSNEHLHHLEEVLNILHDQSLFAKMSKCEFGLIDLLYIGHFIG